MTRQPAMNVLQLLASSRWAMQRQPLEQLLAIAERDLDGILASGLRAGPQDDIRDADDEDDRVRRRRALFTAPATAHAKSERLGVRDNVAILPIVGPLCRYASWIQEVCGLTSYQLAALDFQTALEDPSIRAIMVHLDTPGGEVNGCAELAALIHRSRGRKPIVAMVSDGAASAGYWIAAACDEIVVSPAAYVGSIGVWFEIVDWSERERTEGMRRFQIVSSQSPNKVPDPADDAGRAVLQREVDQFADAFLEAVAGFRGCTVPDLIARGDRGAVFIGRHAVAQRLADRVGTSEQLLAELATRVLTSPATARATRACPTITANQEHMMAKTRTVAAEDGADGNTPPTTTYRIGDRVRVGAGKEHDEMTRDKAGVVRVIATPALGIEFDDMDGIHKWYVDEEVTPDAEGASAPPAEEEDTQMAADDPKDEPAAVRTAFPKAAAALFVEGATAERERIAGILSLPGSAAHAAIVQGCIADPACTRAVAAEKLLAAKGTGGVTDRLAAFLGAETDNAPPKASTGTSTDGGDRADEIIAAHRLVRGKSQ